MPAINSMRQVLHSTTRPFPYESIHSVLGIIAIPGMMTGAILGGASVQQAARLQMIIVFMISACTALATIFTTFAALSIIVDGDDRVRSERIDDRKQAVWRAKDAALGRVVCVLKGCARSLSGGKLKEQQSESTPLLN